MSQNDYQENVQPERNYGTNEIFSLANRSCLIGFNDLMKNVHIAETSEERKSLGKKNKIQVSYVDLTTKEKGKHPKHDFFVDPEEMKYFMEVVYESVIDQQLQSVIRKNGHKFMGGHKKPAIISNIITFKFLTGEELKASPNNAKILKKFQEDSAKYQNAMLDWKNLQVATLHFDKQHGRDMNGLIVPTGKKIEGANFKVYYLTFKDLLELTTTVRDHIKNKEMLFQMESKMVEMEKRMTSSVEKTLKSALSEFTANVGATSAPKQEQKPEPQVEKQQTTSESQPQQKPQDNEREAKLKAEAQWLLAEGKSFFKKHFQGTQMITFLDSLELVNFKYENNVLALAVKFSSGMYNINDFSQEKIDFNAHFERGLVKVLEKESKSYTATVNKL